jgi:hypothetical protein
MGLAMADTTSEDAGLASGLISTTAEVGAALGLAVLATLSSTRSETLTAAGRSTEVALLGGYHLAFAIAGVIVAVSVVVACTVMHPVDKVSPVVPGIGEDEGGDGGCDRSGRILV